MADKKVESAVKEPVDTAPKVKANSSKPVDGQQFINRKLAVLNQRHGAVYENNARRVIENNRRDK